MCCILTQGIGILLLILIGSESEDYIYIGVGTHTNEAWLFDINCTIEHTTTRFHDMLKREKREQKTTRRQ